MVDLQIVSSFTILKKDAGAFSFLTDENCSILAFSALELLEKNIHAHFYIT
jgi:hypothetical protein